MRCGTELTLASELYRSVHCHSYINGLKTPKMQCETPLKVAFQTSVTGAHEDRIC